MGRVSTCQKNCNTIDLRGAQVNDTVSLWKRPFAFKVHLRAESSYQTTQIIVYSLYKW